jgi:hypothetical protein
MRSYQETIQHMGETMYHRYMGGGEPYIGSTGVSLVSFIYEVSVEQVLADMHDAYELLWPATETPAL